MASTEPKKHCFQVNLSWICHNYQFPAKMSPELQKLSKITSHNIFVNEIVLKCNALWNLHIPSLPHHTESNIYWSNEIIWIAARSNIYWLHSSHSWLSTVSFTYMRTGSPLIIYFCKQDTPRVYNYRTRVRSLFTLVSNWLTHWLTDWLTPV